MILMPNGSGGLNPMYIPDSTPQAPPPPTEMQCDKCEKCFTKVECPHCKHLMEYDQLVADEPSEPLSWGDRVLIALMVVGSILTIIGVLYSLFEMSVSTESTFVENFISYLQGVWRFL